ncbi:hypothetical protein MXB_3581 [Myxobolus squamalis]|nr:hypothetical protein MXB_3581 [Myxobolus squamalis]
MSLFDGSTKNPQDVVNNGFGTGHKVPHLAKFLIAKQSVNRIFDETETFMKDVCEFYKNSNLLQNQEFNNISLLEEITNSINRIKVIKTILKRDCMKVAFFGRTSNGKSSVINAILGRSILPSGIGHTTSCFVSMRGCHESEPYVIAPESPDKRNVNDLRQLANAVSDTNLGPNNLINVYWPIENPGIDVDHDLDTWINQYCRDADVFVLVVNSESTLNNSEKKFFHEVNKYISSPNVFILNNRWDASAHELEIEAIKAQHLKRCVDFLSKELKCVSHDEAIERVHFTSAIEIALKINPVLKKE